MEDCIHLFMHLIPFQVKVTDMGGILSGTTAGTLRGAQALRFFQTHQIRVCFNQPHQSQAVRT